MAIRVKLDTIIEGLEAQSFECYSFLDKRTGQLALINDGEMHVAEDDECIEELPEWERDTIRSAQQIACDADNYIQLPTKSDIDEYSIIEDFCYSLQDVQTRDRLLGLITGAGAFRRFKDAVDEYDISKQWYEYRAGEFRQIAIDWCKEHCIEFEEK